MEHAVEEGLHEAPGSSFNEINDTLLFITMVWVVGKVFSRLGMPTLIGEIAVGVIMGPHLLDVVPKFEALMLYGEVGLMLLVLEAGLDVDIEMLKLIGARGVGVAVSGSITPLAIASFLSSQVIGLDWKASLAVGCTLAPTSMGIALNVLKRGKVLNTPTGQLIIAAAVLDDVIALILLAELQVFEAERVQPLRALLPLVASVGLMLGIGWLGTAVVPTLMARGMARVPEKHREKVLLGVLLFLAIVLVPTCHNLGSSHLLGAFLAGLCFCSDERAHRAWGKQVKRVLQWLLRIFFAATIGFEIPIRDFFSAEVFGQALLLFVAVLGKVATGFWVMPLRTAEFFKVGFAMAAWGEFAFITATTARAEGIIDQKTFSAVILAVVISVVVSPILLRWTIVRSSRHAVASIEAAAQSTVKSYVCASTHVPSPPSAEGATRQPSLEEARRSLLRSPLAQPCFPLLLARLPVITPRLHAVQAPVCYHLHTQSSACWGLNARLLDALSDQSLHVLDFRSQHADYVINELYLKDLRLHAPPTTRLPPHKEAAVRQRVSGILAVLSPIFADGGTVTLVRWLPVADKTTATATPPLAAEEGGAEGGGSGGSGGGGGGAGGRVGGRAAAAAAAAAAMAASAGEEAEEYEEVDLFKSYKSQRPQTLEGFVNKTSGPLLGPVEPSDARGWRA
ncbi:hypothetical protein AB1Y20_017021 [Prymnesium parvum]|uniref:Cation/H+ exchanger transmembrane domain-containing protein n=1 Tax=Prymnesium parvum TaxID=97485 RepID=A0AB34IBF7_PRYPA